MATNDVNFKNFNYKNNETACSNAMPPLVLASAAKKFKRPSSVAAGASTGGGGGGVRKSSVANSASSTAGGYYTRSKGPNAAKRPAPVYKKNVSSDDEDEISIESTDDDDDDDDDDDYEDHDGEDEDGFMLEDDDEDSGRARGGGLDIKSYRGFLASLFPSKYMTDKAKNTVVAGSQDQTPKRRGRDNKETISPCPPAPRKLTYAKKDRMADRLSFPSLEREQEEEQEEAIAKKYCDSTRLNKNKGLKRKNEKEEKKLAQPSKFNIIFTLDSGNGNGNGRGRYLEDDEDYTDEEDDEDYTDDEEDYTDEDDDTDEDEEYSEEDEEDEEYSEEAAEAAEAAEEEKDSVPSSPSNETFSDTAAFTKFNAMIASLTPAELKNSVIKKMIEDMAKKEKAYHKSQEKKQRKSKKKNTEKFRSLLREKNVMNDLRFFQDKMSLEEQQKVLVQMDEIKKFSEVEKPYRLSLLDADIPTAFKACAFKKITTLKYMEPGSGEYHKIKNWVDTFMQIPYGKYKSLPLTIDDGVEKCHEFMDGAKKILDEAVFGLNDAKLQIMQMVGQWITNPSAIGTAIAIKGPMGTGKTTLVKEGISKILGRDFAFIALGGATDSSFLEGHSYTYEGSSWGKIVEILIQCKCMNPVIYFDELDKVSDTPKGEEIIGILTHLTDTTQNSKFHDKYFAELDFDLSKCLFIFSYNDESKVNPILRDRMYRIHTKDYDQTQKTTIAKDYLLPKIREQVRFKAGDIILPDETLHHIIEKHTEKESGVRNLKRCLEIIHTKLNLYRLMKPGTNLFESDMSIKVEFPMEVSPEIVDKLIKKAAETGAWTGMYS